MNAVLLKQLDAIEAQIELLKVMVAGIRHTVSTPRAREAPLPATCTGQPEADCARRNAEAAIEMGRGETATVMCRGCGLTQT